MTFRAISPTTTLPTITRFISLTDHGPCDDGEPSAHCPHCGAGGRYIWTFQCDDGTTRGAMKGCVQLFRVSPIATIDQKLTARLEDLKKRFGPASHLNGFDQKQRDVLTAFYDGQLPENAALLKIRSLENEKINWRRSRKGGRRW